MKCIQQTRNGEGVCEFFFSETVEWNVVVERHVVLQYICEEFRIYRIL
jgi:hypothetical protein